MDKGSKEVSMINQIDKISIIIPVYNGGEFIKETIRFLQQSTYENLEMILVNDGSTDNSVEVIEQMSAEDGRIVLYTKENGGVVSARNYGVEKATGDFICFCDQDDIVMKETYQRLYERIQADGSDMCICTSGRNIEGKKSLFDVVDDDFYEGSTIDEKLVFPILFNGFHVPFKIEDVNRYPHIWTCMFRTEFWKRYNFKFRAYINFEDDLLLKIETLSRATKVSTIAYDGYYWRVNLKSETYAHKYVSNIGQKQQCVFADLKQSLEYRKKDNKVMEIFEQITLCKQYVDAVHNLTSPYQKKSWKFIHEYYRENIYARNFPKAIKARKLLKKGRVKPGILLPLLAGRMTMLSYWMELALDMILLVTLKSQTLTKLERYLKK